MPYWEIFGEKGVVDYIKLMCDRIPLITCNKNQVSPVVPGFLRDKIM